LDSGRLCRPWTNGGKRDLGVSRAPRPARRAVPGRRLELSEQCMFGGLAGMPRGQVRKALG
jgi:hypothetical protein